MIATFTASSEPSVVRLRIGGELDLAESSRLSICCADVVEYLALEAPFDRPSVVELDLAAVGFIDVGSLRLLDALRREVGSAGHTFRIVAASKIVRRVSELAQFRELTRAMCLPEEASPQPPRRGAGPPTMHTRRSS